jgi:hypothetical protein
MNKFKRKSLCLALATGLCATGVAGTASAVNVNSDGLGQVLIYPYYTVRNGFDTYISVTNTTNYPKAVKVRFLEGKNSREVLDFNLYMSANDMWTGAIVATTNGAKLITADKSCTAPAIPSAGVEFRNAYYSGAPSEGIQYSLSTVNNGDGEVQTLDRTREGYFEIIEMGMITDTAVTAAVTHVSGTPANCAYVQQPALVMNMGNGGNHPLSSPTGGLSGNASLINVAAGTDYGYDPTAIDNFARSGSNLWAEPGSINPNLADGDSTSVVINGTAVLESSWYYNEDAVTAVLMHDNVINDYVLDSGTLSGTDWVVTMPTKRYYVPVDNPANNITFNTYAPFTSTFWTGGACEPVGVSYFDREEQYVSSIDFSPSTPNGNSLCWESTVITFNNSNVLGSANGVNVPVNYANGWMNLAFNPGSSSTHYVSPFDYNTLRAMPTRVSYPGNNYTTYNVTYYGLPVVGFMLQDFVNQNAAPGIMATYGGNFNHKYVTDVYY